MIPLRVRNAVPMMADEAPGDTPEQALAPLVNRDGWSFEVKFTGVRCLATVEGGKAFLRSADGADLTSDHRAVVGALEAAFPQRDVILDGILLSPDELMVFDVLYDGHDRRTKAYAVRMVMLDRLMADATGARLLRAVRSPDGRKIWQTSRKYDMEGVVAKKVTAPYGKSADWLIVRGDMKAGDGTIDQIRESPRG